MPQALARLQAEEQCNAGATEAGKQRVLASRKKLEELRAQVKQQEAALKYNEQELGATRVEAARISRARETARNKKV